jgi:radical SAM protein with 4Fe4S-binding SPASM domain
MAELDGLFATMAGIGSFRLGLTGGEPTLRRDLFDIIDLATDHGLHPCVTTNGLLLTEDMARQFGKRELVWLNVSLDGATRQSNDRVRGAGTFDKVLANLRLLREHARFTLAFTIMKENAREAAAFARLARNVGADTAVFRPLYPVGTARSHLDSLMPDFEAYGGALNELAALEAADDPDLHVIDPFSPVRRAPTQAVTHANHGCGAANTVCSVSVSGDVNPCSFLGPDYVADNIRRRSLAEIWQRSERFRAMRALPGGEAGTFSGGCRARALVLNGAVNAPDPWIEGSKGRAASAGRFHHPSDIVELWPR